MRRYKTTRVLQSYSRTVGTFLHFSVCFFTLQSSLVINWSPLLQSSTVQLTLAVVVLTSITGVFCWCWGGYFYTPAVCWGSGGRRWQGWCRLRRLQPDDRRDTRSSSYLEPPEIIRSSIPHCSLTRFLVKINHKFIENSADTEWKPTERKILFLPSGEKVTWDRKK